MRKCRIVFEKTGKAKYISHLDLMRTMQRIFVRADISIKHTEGFNPHPYMVFALPLSVGAESVCELLDIELEDDGEDFEKIPSRLNKTAPDGIVFTEAYVPDTKFKNIAFLSVTGIFEYDNGADDSTINDLNTFFGQDEIVIKKKTKRGYGDTDIKPGIKDISFELVSSDIVKVSACVTAQNPTTNPELIVSALREKRAELAPDFAEFKRLSMLDGDMKVFR